MTTALGIAAVTAALRSLLSDRMVDAHVVDLLGAESSVSVLPPDRVEAADAVTGLNLFLYRVSANAGWRNEGLPARDSTGRQRLANAPLALDLHYLLTAYGATPLHAEALLGFAMQWLHETPVLTRGAIRAALAPPAEGADKLQQQLLGSALADQLELVKFTPEFLDTEELSKLWTAMGGKLRPSAAYRATVVLIRADEPLRAPLPVLTRGQPIPGTTRDEGVAVRPSLVPPLPTLESAAPADGQLAMRLGVDVELRGHHLDGADRRVLLDNEFFRVSKSFGAAAGDQPDQVRFAISDADVDDYPVGVYRVGVRVIRPGETVPRESNRLALTVAPDLLGLPMSVARVGGTASLDISFRPALRAGQRATLVLGEQEYEPKAPAGDGPWTALQFVIADAPAAPAPGLLARLRIDGIDSPIVARTATPPVFLDQRIVIT